jgi:diguanylate cyclase (GGDEF)-like protein
MNIVMASLAVQLTLYAVAWLLLGLGFKVRRRVAILWSAGWFAGACCTLLVFLSGSTITFSVELAVNLSLASCFLLLQQGVDAFAEHPSRRWEFVGVLLGMALVEVLRQLGSDWTVWRISLFTLILCWPLGVTTWRMAHWLRHQANYSNSTVALIVSPLLVTMALFALRLALVVQGTALTSVDFSKGTEFDLWVTLLLLAMLGAFNFSLATLVLGDLIERLRTLSQTDQLTGLANRRVMMHRLNEEHARYKRSGHRYGVIMLDLDFFKRVNDTHGHGVGDQVLCGVANVLGSGLRNTDTVARMGGEEFMLLAPLTEEAGAMVQAQRLCRAVREARLVTDAGPLPLTMSLGVACVLPTDASVDAVVSRADAALYLAKTTGRDRVQLAS